MLLGDVSGGVACLPLRRMFLREFFQQGIKVPPPCLLGTKRVTFCFSGRNVE